MRQKYEIHQGARNDEVTIKEYAVIDKNLKKIASPHLRSGDFTLLCKETYDSELLENSISEGRDALINALRTPNLYPIGPYVEKIADSIIRLVESSDLDSIELFFDDIDLIEPEPEPDEALIEE